MSNSIQPTHSFAIYQRQMQATSALANTSRFVLGAAATGVGVLAGPAAGRLVDGLTGVDGKSGPGGSDLLRLESLFQLQVQKQTEMQLISMRSNLSHTEHESRMAAVRNMRA